MSGSGMSEVSELTQKEKHKLKTQIRQNAKTELESEIHYIRDKYNPQIAQLKNEMSREINAAHLRYREALRQARTLTD